VTKNDLTTFTYVTVVVMCLALAMQLWLIDNWVLGLFTFRRVSVAISFTVLFWVLVSKWAWKWWPMNALFHRPKVVGTWLGELQSNWFDDNGRPRRLIPIVFTIRQSFLWINVRSFTQDREGLSDVAVLVQKDDAGITYLSYIYSIREAFRAGLGSQQGAAEVRVLGQSNDELRGEYWTNTRTCGRIILKHASTELVDSFDAAQKQFPNSISWASFT
jgi:hypothetical protein